MSQWGREFTRIVLVGDSLTQFSFTPGGWGARLADCFQRRADILNRGFSGYNTEWMKLILPELLPKKAGTADIVTILFGSNDSSLPDTYPQQHVPLLTYKSNLVEMCGYLKALGFAKASIILLTPPPLHDSLWDKTCRESSFVMNRSSSVMKQYAEAALQAGDECGVTTLDLHTAMSNSGEHLERYLSDGLHFTAAGNQFLAELLIPVVEGLLEGHGVSTVYPDWQCVDAKCPKESFRKL